MPERDFEDTPEPGEVRMRCLKESRIGGCGRYYKYPARVRGVVIVPALWCPACFEAKLKAGNERAKRILENSR